MNAHDQLDQGSKGHEKEDGGKGHMISIINGLALGAFELNLIIIMLGDLTFN